MIIKSLARGGRVRGGRCRWMAADERRRVVAECCIFDRITLLLSPSLRRDQITVSVMFPGQGHV